MFNNILNITKSLKLYKSMYSKKNIFSSNLLIMNMAKLNGSIRVQIDYINKLNSRYKTTNWVYNHINLVYFLYLYLTICFLVEFTL